VDFTFLVVHVPLALAPERRVCVDAADPFSSKRTYRLQRRRADWSRPACTGGGRRVLGYNIPILRTLLRDRNHAIRGSASVVEKTGDDTEKYDPATAGSIDKTAPAGAGAVPVPPPDRVGRYRIERVIGQGGFGIVFLAHDEQLQRRVAIKVPYRRLVDRQEDAEAHLTEAQTVAGLDHPNIIPVYDVGSTAEFPCFIVSKYIDGTDLASRLRQRRLTLRQAVELVATVAEALHHAHRHGLVHRDIKPGNLLLDKNGNPYIADFGLALREQDLGIGTHSAGTPAYMSPEQARGEGHRVDARSDIFSLGVVLYELLVGRKPFQAKSQAELREQVTSFEVRPPRQYDEHIPKELDRICLKAVSKRPSDRYSTAEDMADDLRHFLADQSAKDASGQSGIGNVSALFTPVGHPPSTVIASNPSGTSVMPATLVTADGLPRKIVPKGLRSFDAHDADFFLELVPGACDRHGLPDSIRFWKLRIEEPDGERTFSVGLIYGPSGCGKSSLVKAGLLPCLSDDIIAVYVEATARETEARLLNGLRNRCPALYGNLSLSDSLAALRRGQGLPVGKKVLIVLDQFEQWLHARTREEDTRLVDALRHCDGGRVQCIVLVRDDFWMAATRFMRELEIRLLEGQNSASVDLFDRDHARKVLAAFGRAFGRLPESGSGETTKEQAEFLNQAVTGLVQDGKVICVRLAVFAEMMKGKPWTPATLREVGGTEGVGATFLEETFSAATAPPEHRYHQQAARGVLKSLLPESGTDIKGHMRSHADLLAASGYANRSQDFEDLIRILDREIRLITPTDPEGKVECEPGGIGLQSADARFYQLTHDYLVHSLRDWLTRKQKETRRGRAELLLVDRAAVWHARPENRQLPSLLQWLQIRWLTSRTSWSTQQRTMMQRASGYHAARAIALFLVLSLATFAGLAIRRQVIEQRNATLAAALVERVLDAETEQVPVAIAELAGYRRWVDPLLRAESDKAPANSREKLHASLGLLPTDPTQVDYLVRRLLDAEPHDVVVIRDALAPYQQQLLQRLWSVVEVTESGKESERLRASSALASYDPENPRWSKAGVLVAGDLVLENPIFLGQWSAAFRPVKDRLIPELSRIFRDPRPERTAERSLAADLLAGYAADKPDLLAELLMDADPKQFTVIYPMLKDHGEQGASKLSAELREELLPVQTEWTARFHKWEKSTLEMPPADWEKVVSSPVLDERKMARLSLGDATRPPKPPTQEVPQDYFALVATTEVTLESGPLLLTAKFDDGIRVWLDDRVVLENWGPNAPTTKSATIGREPGRHLLKVEYFQIEGAYVLDVDLTIHDIAKETLAKRQANAAIALLRMNQPAKFWPLLKLCPDPRVRSYIIHRVSRLGVDSGTIIKQLEAEPDITIRRAIILSLGEYDERNLSAETRKSLLPRIEEIYLTQNDPGLHGAAEWLLKKWQHHAWLKNLADECVHDKAQREKRLEIIKERVISADGKASPQWYVNAQGQTMVVIPGPVEFVMGSPPTEVGRYDNETQHRRRIDRTFALAAKSVTVEQYRRFDKKYSLPESYTRMADLPAVNLDWFMAAKLCNFMSTAEGIGPDQHCYEINGDQIKMKENYLNLTGYRLPTEPEMEYATRAGTETARYFGETEELMSEYAWYLKNSQEKSWPVGSLKPNDLGLFDVQGNVLTWCQESYNPFPRAGEASDDNDDELVIVPTTSRMLRGGSFSGLPSAVRSGFRNFIVPTYRYLSFGVRPARTLQFTPSPDAPAREKR
jgi:serine/threonine protein kinase/formylglycine-generating enzyme required for sulfatase activity